MRISSVLCFFVFFNFINGELIEDKKTKKLEEDVESLRNLVLKLHDTIYLQEDRIKSLEEKSLKLEHANRGHIAKISDLRRMFAACVTSRKEDATHVEGCSNTSSTFKKRLLAPTDTTTEGAVAFYAYMSTSLINPSMHHTLIFDTTITNVGNGYHPNTGVFIVPESGLYVFTWIMRLWSHSYHGTELMVKKAIMGSVFLSSTGNDHSVTGMVVVHVTQGDDVFIRTQGDSNVGNIGSDYHGKSSFAGWKIN